MRLAAWILASGAESDADCSLQSGMQLLLAILTNRHEALQVEGWALLPYAK